ncbi:MAG: hypothetical protein RL247_295 [Actinomycetota bacterium]
MASADKARKGQLRQFEARQAHHAYRAARTRKDQFIGIVSAVAAITVSALSLWAYGTIGPGRPAVVADPSLSENRSWVGTLEFEKVSLGITLDGAAAPQAVANFIDLNERDYFDTSACHRITTEGLFVVQCGDPLGIGIGNPGYTFGPIENAPADNVYKAGTIAMARASNDGESMGSQFFIVYEDSEIPADIAGGYTIFGEVTEGLDEFVSAYVTSGTADGSTDGQPAFPVVISSITIR